MQLFPDVDATEIPSSERPTAPLRVVSDFETCDLENVTGGAGEGLFGAVRVGLLGASLLSGNPSQMPPKVEPIRIEMPAPRIGVTQK